MILIKVVVCGFIWLYICVISGLKRFWLNNVNELVKVEKRYYREMLDI